MLKERARILAVAIFTLDLFLVSAAFLCAYGLRHVVLPWMAPATFPSRLHSLTDYLPLLPLALAIWGGLLLSSGRYRSHRTVPLLDEAWAILRVCVSGAILFTLVLYLSRWDERLLGADRVSRFWSLLFAAFSCLFLLTEKLGLRLTSRYVRAHGFNYRTVLIVGTNDAALRIAESIHGHRFWGYRILGFIRNGHAWEESWPTRCGLNGRSFTLYKFRTMVADAEDRRGELLHLNEMNGPVFKLRSDPRVTTLGRFLRRFSLDELPQLWNVLRGDMSLVGPRPPIPEEVAQYQRWQRRRLAMKPGLTCLWQISGRNNVDFDRWMQLDLEYIDSWTPMLDLKILLKTVPVVLSGKGAS